MHTIIYSSVSAGGDAAAEAPAILGVSRALNGIDGVTGLLCASEDRFVQVLEGPQDSVRSAFERIKRDPRHRSIETLLDAPVDRRQFADWAMAYPDDEQPREVFIERLKLLLGGVSDETAARFALSDDASE